ncbi:MAG: sugar transferase [Candidatus Omnitrophica bacterium]|nr:sugar transferase [Candidatus Omnitrophota bacterium]
MDYPMVSLIMPCRNEKDFIRKSLGSFLNTHYPLDKLEIIVVDGSSDDGTREIVEEISREHSNIRVLSNPKKYVPFAMNIGIRASRGEIIIRADAHTKYPPDYISKCIEYLEKTDAWCVGGPFYSEPSKNTLTAKIITYILSSPFGVGTSYFRTHKKSMYTETVPYGAFKKEVFDKIGLYDERFIRAQDYELCRRLAKHGGKIFMTPEIKNIYHPPSNVRDFIRKAQFTGTCNAINLRYYAYTFHWRHFIPFIFFAGFIICSILVFIGAFASLELLLFGIAPVVLYFILAFSASIGSYLRKKIPLVAAPYMTGIFFLYHFMYGYGTFIGMISADPKERPVSKLKNPYPFKRIFDIFLSLAGIFMFLPVWALIIFLYCLEKEKIFFIQERVGKLGTIFKVIKFRTMNDKEEVKKKFHKFLRSSALDESPQLINIFKGEMSFVGPRPLVLKEVLGSRVIQIRGKSVPGLTGPAQILLSKDDDPEKKAGLDKWYISKMSFLLDIKIILVSLKITLGRRWESKGKKLKDLSLFDDIKY